MIEQLKKDGVTVIVNQPTPHAEGGRIHEGNGRQPQPAARRGLFRKLGSVRWLQLVVAIVWEIVGLSFLALIYLLVTSQGLTELSPSVFGQRMSKLPGFAWMAGYQGWHRLTVGHVAAVGLMIFVTVAWFLLVRDWLLTRGNQLDEWEWRIRNASLFWRIAGLGLMFADGVLFFRGLVEINNWSLSPDYFSAAVLTVVYLSALMVFSFMSVLLWSYIRRVES